MAAQLAAATAAETGTIEAVKLSMVEAAEAGDGRDGGAQSGCSGGSRQRLRRRKPAAVEVAKMPKGAARAVDAMGMAKVHGLAGQDCGYAADR